MHTVVVPTDGSSHLLAGMLEVCPAPVIVIWTNGTEPAPGWLLDRAQVLQDVEQPLNIHRWWNTGIRAARTDVVVVANDDLSWHADTSSQMARLDGRTLSMVARPQFPDRISGWLWGLDRTHGVLPDEQFYWWYGDNDLAWRAEDAHGIRWVGWEDAKVRHQRFRTTRLLSLIHQDRQRWQKLSRFRSGP